MLRIPKKGDIFKGLLHFLIYTGKDSIDPHRNYYLHFIKVYQYINLDFQNNVDVADFELLSEILEEDYKLVSSCKDICKDCIVIATCNILKDIQIIKCAKEKGLISLW